MSSSHYSVQDPAQPQSGTGGLSADQAPTRQDGYDKLVSDKPGEELAPDSAIWKLYAEEAKEYDNDLVADHNKNLDTMLLFVRGNSAKINKRMLTNSHSGWFIFSDSYRFLD